VLAFLIQQDPSPYVPPESVDHWGQLTMLASNFGDMDNLFYFTYAVCIFFFVLITGILGYSVVKYRRRTYDQPAAANITHNTVLEVVWTVIPLIIVMVIFAWGWKGSLDMSYVPADARQYRALAKQWDWTFFYPNDPGTSTGELWLEVNKPAAFTLESIDVLHAFYMPSMRIKRDVVPGRYQTTWFMPTQLGDYHLFCAEYCGRDHSRMYSKVHVVSAEAYGTRPWDTFDLKDPPGNGAKIYNTTCKACHSLDGSIVVGPSFKGVWGKTEKVVARKPGGGWDPPTEVTVNLDYLKESLRDPDAKKVVGFQGQQMTVQGEAAINDQKVEWLAAFLEDLAKNPEKYAPKR